MRVFLDWKQMLSTTSSVDYGDYIVCYSISDFGMVEYGNNNNNADAASSYMCGFLLDYICISPMFDGDKYFFMTFDNDSIAVPLILL